MQALKHTAATQTVILALCVAAAWAVELVDQVAFRGSLERFGIHPRDVAALWGILAAPLLHAGWVHLVANTGPFVVLAWLVMLRKITDFVVVTALAILIGGLGVWLFGAPNSIHVGASGLILVIWAICSPAVTSSGACGDAPGYRRPGAVWRGALGVLPVSAASRGRATCSVLSRRCRGAPAGAVEAARARRAYAACGRLNFKRVARSSLPRVATSTPGSPLPGVGRRPHGYLQNARGGACAAVRRRTRDNCQVVCVFWDSVHTPQDGP